MGTCYKLDKKYKSRATYSPSQTKKHELMMSKETGIEELEDATNHLIAAANRLSTLSVRFRICIAVMRIPVLATAILYFMCLVGEKSGNPSPAWVCQLVSLILAGASTVLYMNTTDFHRPTHALKINPIVVIGWGFIVEVLAVCDLLTSYENSKYAYLVTITICCIVLILVKSSINYRVSEVYWDVTIEADILVELGKCILIKSDSDFLTDAINDYFRAIDKVAHYKPNKWEKKKW